jgi:hydroxymethylpyrimidine/phosphomethylpyrimidine kinase
VAERHTPTALSIAGTDSGGGAGTAADLKAFARCGVHGTIAITAITAQNTTGVSQIHAIPAEMILAQVRAVLADIRVDAVKVGMLGTVQSTHAVARALAELPPGTPIVVDPVMVAESGARLLDDDARQALIELILPLASVITPNLPEARALASTSAPEADRLGGGHATDDATPGLEAQEMESLARALVELGAASVVVTGGHATRSVDLFLERGASASPVEIAGERHPDGAAHGSGCTHSSLLAAQLALGETPLRAARAARALAAEAVRDGLRDVGIGAGPVDVLGLARIRARGVRPW